MSCMHGMCGKETYHFAMVVVEDGDPFAEEWAVKRVEACKRKK